MTYRLVILGFVAVTTVVADTDLHECRRLVHPHSMRCCKKSAEAKDKMMKDGDFKECFELPKDPVKCEHELCMAKKKGITTSDDKLDKAKFEEMVTKDIDDKDLVADIKENCINGDLQKYGPPEFCDFIKLRHCMSMQILNHCSEWNDFGECKQIKEIIGDCVKLLA